jgi:hypothetical protein
MSVKNQTDDPTNPPTTGGIVVDLSNVTVLEAAQLIESAAPGKFKVNLPIGKLQKRVKFRANKPIEIIAKRIGLERV